MKKIKLLLIIPLVLCLSSGVAFGWGASGGDGSSFGALQETAVFFNNSGIKMVHGHVVTLDTGGSNVSAGTTLGSYVDLISASSSVLAVGVVKQAANNQFPVVVVTKGPIDTLSDDSSDGVTSGASVGTSNSTGRVGMIGGGDNLGLALEGGDGTDNSYLFIWVAPSGAAD